MTSATGFNPGFTSRIALSPDSSEVAITNTGASIIFVELATGARRTYFGNFTPVSDMTYSNDGNFVFVGRGAQVDLYNVGSGQEIKTFKGSGKAIALNEDNSLLLGADEFGAVRIWETGLNNINPASALLGNTPASALDDLNGDGVVDAADLVN